LKGRFSCTRGGEGLPELSHAGLNIDPIQIPRFTKTCLFLARSPKRNQKIHILFQTDVCPCFF